MSAIGFGSVKTRWKYRTGSSSASRAVNRLAELAGWDREILKIEFQALAELDLDFDLEITGFETAELDLLLDDSAEEAADEPADAVPEPDPGPAVTRPGDIGTLAGTG